MADIVRSANAQGVEWSFDVQPHPDIDPRDGGFWVYDGPPLEILPREVEAVELPPTTFLCPHCGKENTQDPVNFHFWCGHCGKNAKDLTT